MEYCFLQDVEYLRQLVIDEIKERYEEGYDINIERCIDKVYRLKTCNELMDFYYSLNNLKKRRNFTYYEPFRLEDFLKNAEKLDYGIVKKLEDKVLGGWLGRCAGCMFGKPVEGWKRKSIIEALKRIGEYPLNKPYFPLEIFEGTNKVKSLTRGNITRVERDDDIDYTILNLLVLEEYGNSFTSNDVAKTWLLRLPWLLTYTAEREAYRNLVIGLKPPRTATFLNPYREWIGAAIRADLWGYISSGKPTLAIRYAYRDALLSHTKNGLYGEIYIATLISLAFFYDNIFDIVQEGLKVIPRNSRFAEAIRFIINLYKRGIIWEEAIELILEKFGRYSSVHVINNEAIVTAALLWGEGNFDSTLKYAVLAGLDTDCNGATSGSVLGVFLGAKNLPKNWVEPLNNRVMSALSGIGEQYISHLAHRTLKIIKKNRE